MLPGPRSGSGSAARCSSDRLWPDDASAVPRRRHDRVACCVDAFSSRLKAAACVQAVHELYDVAEGPQWTDGEERCTRVVVIGRCLDRAQLEQSLRQACLPGKA